MCIYNNVGLHLRRLEEQNRYDDLRQHGEGSPSGFAGVSLFPRLAPIERGLYLPVYSIVGLNIRRHESS